MSHILAFSLLRSTNESKFQEPSRKLTYQRWGARLGSGYAFEAVINMENQLHLRGGLPKNGIARRSNEP